MFLKILISVVAIVLIYAHLFCSYVTIDNIVLILLVFAMFPWIGQLITSIEFNGVAARFRSPNSGADPRDVDVENKELTDSEIWKEYNGEK